MKQPVTIYIKGEVDVEQLLLLSKISIEYVIPFETTENVPPGAMDYIFLLPVLEES